MLEQFVSDQQELCTTLNNFVNEQHVVSALHSDLILALSSPGKLLAPVDVTSEIPSGIWALLNVHIARYCQPDLDQKITYQLAIAVECLVTALDLFDELEDNDQSSLRDTLGDARFLQTATTLLTLADKAILSLALPAQTILQLMIIYKDQLKKAHEGQHLDLLSENKDMDIKASLDITARKSGSLLQLVCLLAAHAASVTEEIEDYFGQVGILIGSAYQIDNDLSDFTHLLDETQAARKSDLSRGKRTLPILLAKKQYQSLLQKTIIADDSELKAEQEKILKKQSYEDAVQAANGVQLYFRRRAYELVNKIQAQLNRRFPDTLLYLLSLHHLLEQIGLNNERPIA